jgi:hypothetical protein
MREFKEFVIVFIDTLENSSTFNEVRRYCIKAYTKELAFYAFSKRFASVDIISVD